MAQLAIKGHKERGEEVIKILEMLGGEDEYKLRGNNEECAYFEKNGVINTSQIGFNNIKLFTLEEFLEKFPYKVGDKVIHNMGILMNVVHMRWDAECNVIRYDIQSPVDNNYNLKAMLAEHLQPYKEETIKEIQYKELRMPLDDDDKLATEVTINGNKILPPNGYLIGKITQVDNGMLVEYVKKQPQYPKTYEECCEVLDYEPDRQTVTGYDAELIENFQKLLICRDTYWKIAGERKGLGKPWEFENPSRYYVLTIENFGGEIQKNAVTARILNRILVFPTEEMRDAFYENFKELIEACKELL